MTRKDTDGSAVYDVEDVLARLRQRGAEAANEDRTPRPTAADLECVCELIRIVSPKLRTPVLIDPKELFAELMTIVDLHFLDKAAWQTIRREFPEGAIKRIQQAAKRFQNVVLDEKNALGARELLKLFPEGGKSSDISAGEHLCKAMSIGVLTGDRAASSYKPRLPVITRVSQLKPPNGFVAVDWLVRHRLAPAFQQHFQCKPTSVLGTMEQPDSAFLRFTQGSLALFAIHQDDGSPYTAFTLATYMKRRQTGARRKR
jgi:hypothetical protein